MGPWLFFVTLLGLTFSVNGQPENPPPPQPTPSILAPYGVITSSAGNIQLMYNDQLRAIIRGYGITPKEIQKMLELYARGGSPTIIKSRMNPDTATQEVTTLNFEQFITTSPSRNDYKTSEVKSVSTTADVLQSQPTPKYKPADGPSDTSPPRRNTLADLRDAEIYILNQITQKDSEKLALDRAYRTGQITRITWYDNAIENRERRRQLGGDLRLLRREISRMTMPQARKNPPREVRIGSGPALPLRPLDRDILRRERENKILEEQLQGGDDSRSTSPSEIPRVQQPSVRPTVLSRPVGSTSASYEALRRELLQIRARERYILRRLQMLAARNPRLLMRDMMPNSRNTPLRGSPMIKSINFSSMFQPRPQRSLTGSVLGRPSRPDPLMQYWIIDQIVNGPE